MDIEHLNKSQLILLTLLITFVTSIATGIVTVSLMQQAPPVVAQTINRIVERTVEKVVPQENTGQTSAAATVVTRETTKIVKETDLIPQAVAAMSPSVVRLYADTGEGVFLSLALVVGKEGTLITDSSGIGERGTVGVGLSDGARVTGLVIARDTETGLATLSTATSTDKGPIVWRSISRGAAPTLGTTVVTLAGTHSLRVGTGIVNATPSGTPEIIETSIADGSILPGSPLFNTDGSVVGVSTGVSRASGQGAFVVFSATR
jgi:S1-C subfamily serine protease